MDADLSWAPQKHADIILAQDVLEYAPLFTEIADAYFEREMYAEARYIYEILGGDAGVSIPCYASSRSYPDECATSTD